ncbi:putative reverse transcriptase domain-containing protein [Tanacetum coccineum]|uniref:Reverse transcriptase domain-containing protein n=1 Tax=Tanacetum coccineum TaxID=301880 RepID=A0ABQ4Z3Y6_9ASTR
MLNLHYDTLELSKRKFVIVCHEKVVRIPLEGEETLRVHGERTQGVVKTLMNTNVGESELSDISAVQDFIDVFLKDLSMTTATTKQERLFKLNVVIDALRRKEEVKPRRVRAMAMTIQYGVRGMILAAQSEAFKRENHPQADGQSERMIQTLEDTLRACVTDFGGSYQLRIRCAPFEALYGRKCRSPVIWAEIGGSSLIGPELVQETIDKVVLIKEKLKALRDRVVRFGKKGKLAPRYVGPFEILERIGPVAYQLRLPKELSGVHDTFHVSNLKKCLADASLHVPLDEIKVNKTLRFVEEPVENSDCEVMRFLTSFLDDGRSSGSWMFLFVWSGYAAMRTPLWAGKVVSGKGGSPASIHGLFSEWYCGLASRKVTLGVSMAWAKGVTTGTLVIILRMLKLGRVASKTVGLHAESFS